MMHETDYFIYFINDHSTTSAACYYDNDGLVHLLYHQHDKVYLLLVCTIYHREGTNNTFSPPTCHIWILGQDPFSVIFQRAVQSNRLPMLSAVFKVGASVNQRVTYSMMMCYIH